MVSLTIGGSGPDVERLQRILNAELIPSPGLTEDGDFGRKTHDAVVRFQEQRGITPASGRVGPKTWNALEQKIASQPAGASTKTGVPWMDIALLELGVHENSLPGSHNKRIVEYHSKTSLKATDDETPWCASFVNWVMDKAGYKGTNSALARSWLDWGGICLANPQYGAITVIKRKGKSSDKATGSSTGFHVAFFVSMTSTHIRLLGGNQGDQVKESSFSLASYEVKGYRWPG